MNPIVPNENCLTSDQIVRYLRDETTPDETRAIDRHIERCPMCSDALEGVMLIGADAYSDDIQAINTKIEKKTTEIISTETPEIQPLKVSYSKSRRYWWIGAAASLALLAVAGTWFFQNKSKAELSNISATTDVVMETAPAPLPPQYLSQDSLTISDKNEPIANVTIAKKTVLTDKKNSQKNTTIAYQEPTTTTQNTPAEYSIARPKLETTTPLEREMAKEDANDFAVPRSVARPQAPAPAQPIRSDTQLNTYAQNPAFDISNDQVHALESEKQQSKEIKNKPVGNYSKNTNTYSGASNQLPSIASAPKPSATKISKKKEVGSFNSSTDIEKDLEKGITLYEEKKYEDAITVFNSITQAKVRGTSYNSASWYLANSYINSGNKAAAKSILQRIVKEKGNFANKASILLEKL